MIIQGHFYKTKSGLQMRSELIICHDLEQKLDLLVVMMNPGSSKPKNSKYEPEVWKAGDKKSFIDAVPDRTQTQIIALMNNLGFKKSHVINLCDIREPKSAKFIPQIQELKKNGHTIFADARNAELEALTSQKPRLILAWGLNRGLLPLSEIAYEKLRAYKPVGIQTQKSDFPLYNHPLPPNTNLQKEWIHKATKLLS